MVEAGLATPGEPGTRAFSSLLPLYVVIFFGFVGYSLMITIFTPMFLKPDSVILPADVSSSYRTIVLGIILGLYPAAQFISSPVLGALSDRYGRRPVLLVSLTITTACYAALALSLTAMSLTTLAVSLFVAGLAEANIVTAQSAIADVVAAGDRNRFFGYIYMCVSLALYRRPAGRRQAGGTVDRKLVQRRDAVLGRVWPAGPDDARHAAQIS